MIILLGENVVAIKTGYQSGLALTYNLLTLIFSSRIILMQLHHLHAAAKFTLGQVKPLDAAGWSQAFISLIS